MTKSRDLASLASAGATVSATELGYVDGVTSAIQTQLDAKIAKTLTTTTGDIIYASGANTPARLGIGTTGQVLNVSGGVPAWATIASGSTYVGASVSNTVGQSIANATETTLTFDTEQFDTDGIHSTSTNTERMTVPAGKGGKWRLSGAFRGAVSGTLWEFYIFVNNAYYITGFPQFGMTQNGRGSMVAVANFELNLAAGDYVHIRVYQTSGSAAEFSGQYSRFQFSYIGA